MFDFAAIIQSKFIFCLRVCSVTAGILKRVLVYTNRYEGQARERPPKEEGKRGPRSRRGKPGVKRASAKCRATRASQVSIVVDCVPEDLCLAACRKDMRLAVIRNCI